jgi:hypothetical protein
MNSIKDFDHEFAFQKTLNLINSITYKIIKKNDYDTHGRIEFSYYCSFIKWERGVMTYQLETIYREPVIYTTNLNRKDKYYYSFSSKSYIMNKLNINEDSLNQLYKYCIEKYNYNSTFEKYNKNNKYQYHNMIGIYNSYDIEDKYFGTFGAINKQNRKEKKIYICYVYLGNAYNNKYYNYDRYNEFKELIKTFDGSICELYEKFTDIYSVQKKYVYEHHHKYNNSLYKIQNLCYTETTINKDGIKEEISTMQTNHKVVQYKKIGNIINFKSFHIPRTIYINHMYMYKIQQHIIHNKIPDIDYVMITKSGNINLLTNQSYFNENYITLYDKTYNKIYKYKKTYKWYKSLLGYNPEEDERIYRYGFFTKKHKLKKDFSLFGYILYL